MIKTLNTLIIGTALAGTLFVSGCASNKLYNGRCNTQNAYSQQISRKEIDFESRLKRIIAEEAYSQPFYFIEEALISDAPRTEGERATLRKKVDQIDLSTPLNSREIRIIERFSKKDIYPVEKVFFRIYGLPYDAKSRIYLNRSAAEIFSSCGFK